MSDTYKDQDGNTFSSVQIGDQLWMAENLNVVSFLNGDPIHQAMSEEEWEDAGDESRPVWCYYAYDDGNGQKYARLYNWYAVTDSRGLAPEGWHIPSDEEWSRLSDCLGADAGAKMKRADAWKINDDASNEPGLNVLPGGYCNESGAFRGVGEYACLWSLTESSEKFAYYRFIRHDSDELFRLDYGKGDGFSCRCIKDETQG